MKIEQDIKLDFSDVLIRPNKTDIKSRNDVDLERNFLAKNRLKDKIIDLYRY